MYMYIDTFFSRLFRYTKRYVFYFWIILTCFWYAFFGNSLWLQLSAVWAAWVGVGVQLVWAATLAQAYSTRPHSRTLGTMCGLQKALVLLLSLFLPVLCGRWDWSESVWYRGSWWRKHFETDYWCLVTADGELAYQSDVDWFGTWGMHPGLNKATGGPGGLGAGWHLQLMQMIMALCTVLVQQAQLAHLVGCLHKAMSWPRHCANFKSCWGWRTGGTTIPSGHSSKGPSKGCVNGRAFQSQTGGRAHSCPPTNTKWRPTSSPMRFSTGSSTTWVLALWQGCLHKALTIHQTTLQGQALQLPEL